MLTVDAAEFIVIVIPVAVALAALAILGTWLRLRSSKRDRPPNQ
jgi:hypothetical protein